MTLNSKLNISVSIALIFGLLLSCINEQHTRFDHTSVDTVSNPKSPFHLDNGYKGEDRHIWQRPELVIGLMGDVQGKTIVDIGAGSGYFAFKFLRSFSSVIAVDIDQRMVDLMNEEKSIYPEALQKRFEARLAKPDDPMVEPGEADIIFIANTTAYFKNRVAYFRNLKAAINPTGGLLMIIDFKIKHTPIGPSSEYRLPLRAIEDSLIEAGYEITTSDDTSLDYQYIVIARPIR